MVIEETILPIKPMKRCIDELEIAMWLYGGDDRKLDHCFTPGLYTRTIFMKAGDRAISRIHKTRHQYIISEGVVSVWIEGEGWALLKSGDRGITEAGTRRILYVHSDTTWTTIHATDIHPFDGTKEAEKEAVDEIERTIIEPNYDVENAKNILSQLMIDKCHMALS